MDINNEVAFAWLWARKDVVVYNQKEYDDETTMYRLKHNMVKADGDTTWFYEFKKDGKKRKTILTTEIWYKKDTDHATSPIALLFGQFFSAGLHITKVKFEDTD